MSAFRILVTGSRDWDAVVPVWGELNKLLRRHGSVTVVHGACPRGADHIADMWAAIEDVGLERHPADWDQHGKSAGFRRNTEMVALGADVCLAFIKDGSRGATHCADAAEKAGIPVRRYVSVSERGAS